MMGEVVADAGLVAYCGLYCGACRAYLKGRCPGCHENQKATWCKVRSCCIDGQLASCADCQQFPNPSDCRLFNNFIAKLFALVFRSDRAACIRQIREIGLEKHAEDMAKQRRQTIKKGTT
jgi:hypothetical protein